jgi:hypothetical protein
MTAESRLAESVEKPGVEKPDVEEQGVEKPSVRGARRSGVDSCEGRSKQPNSQCLAVKNLDSRERGATKEEQ